MSSTAVTVADEHPDGRALFDRTTFATYNAGEGRVRQLRREAEKRGLGPNASKPHCSSTATVRVPFPHQHEHQDCTTITRP